MNPAGVSVWKAAAGAFSRREAGGDAVALQTAVDGAARQLGVDAAPHRLDDVVERQGEAAAQLDDQGFFPIGHGRWLSRCGRVERSTHVLTALPARHGAAVDAEFAGQRGDRGLAFLDIGADARRGRGVGVQLEMHQPSAPLGRLAAPAGRVRRDARPGGSTGTSHAPRRQTRDGRGAGARVPPVDYRDELRLAWPQLRPQPFDSLPQSRAVAPIFRDKTRRPGPICQPFVHRNNGYRPSPV